MQPEDFISRWKASGGSERANFQRFANELCEALGLPHPAPATESMRTNAYCFEHPVTFIHTSRQSRGVIDLDRAGYFVMEAQQGTGTGTATPEQVARQFQRARAGSVQPLLESLTALGQARIVEGGRFAV